MIDYSQLSDRDIDALVLQKVYGNQASDKDIMRAWLRGDFKYTTNPADAWPIISENKISTMWMTSEKEWCAWSEGDLAEGTWDWENVPDYYFNCTSQLRAAMIVFLMMKDAENAPAI